MNDTQIIQDLEKILQNDLSDKERVAVIKDLELVKARYEKLEYAKGFSSPRGFDVQYRTDQAYAELEFLSKLADLWSFIFSDITLTKNHTVIDVCPGYSPKIELALIKRDFEGTVCIIDQDIQAVERLKIILSLFNPRYVMRTVHQNIFSHLGQKGFFAAANHIVDDVVLNEWCNDHHQSLHGIYQDEKLVKAAWNNIQKTTKKKQIDLAQSIAHVFDSFVEPGGYLCFTQYPSYMETLLQLDTSVIYCKNLIDMVSQTLESIKYTRITVDPNNVLKRNGAHFSKEHIYLFKKS